MRKVTAPAVPRNSGQVDRERIRQLLEESERVVREFLERRESIRFAKRHGGEGKHRQNPSEK